LADNHNGLQNGLEDAMPAKDGFAATTPKGAR
jgi:hypothetical protein